MKITILDDWSDTLRTLDCFGKLAGHEVAVWNDHVQDEDALVARLADTEALVLIRERTAIRAPLIRRLPRLRIISQSSTYAHVDLDACTEHGVILSTRRHQESPSVATAELAFGLMLASLRRLPQQMARLQAGGWQSGIGTTAQGKTLGIYGWGRIGSMVAGYARAFGMRVLVWARPESRAKAVAEGYEVPASKEDFFAECDVVSLHMRLLDATRGIVTADDLARMKPSALLINTSRAGLVVPGALVAALRAGRPGMAAVDVFEQEPLAQPDHPLLHMDNVVCTPHIGYVTREGFESKFPEIFDQVLAYAAGQPVNVVNPAALDVAR